MTVYNIVLGWTDSFFNRTGEDRQIFNRTGENRLNVTAYRGEQTEFLGVQGRTDRKLNWSTVKPGQTKEDR